MGGTCAGKSISGRCTVRVSQGERERPSGAHLCRKAQTDASPKIVTHSAQVITQHTGDKERLITCKALLSS